MDFLENSVLPQSAHHMVLLKYLLVLTFILFIPYVSALFGSLTISLYFKRKGEKASDKNYLRLAKDLIDIVTFNKGVAFALGIVPMLSSAFCYAQLLHLSGAAVPGYILLALIFFIISLLLIYTYKYAFHLKSILELAAKQNTEQEDLNAELNSYQKSTATLYSKTGLYGLIFLFIATYIFVAAVQLATDSSQWGSASTLINALFSINAFTYYIQFIALAFAVTSALILYKYFRPNSDAVIHDENYSAYVKTFALRLGLISTIILPLLIIINVVSKPALSYSYDLFGAALIALLVLLLISNLYYVMLKESKVKFSAAVLYLFVVVFAFLILKDQFAFDTSTKKQYAIIAANYEEYQKQLNEKLGIATTVINGADIYNGKCIACHKFDVKLVGPPYKETLPKYEGKMDELVSFIMNPVKKNPAYPAMPNQGLKPNEAEAVAKYIMETYKK